MILREVSSFSLHYTQFLYSDLFLAVIFITLMCYSSCRAFATPTPPYIRTTREGSGYRLSVLTVLYKGRGNEVEQLRSRAPADRGGSGGRGGERGSSRKEVGLALDGQLPSRSELAHLMRQRFERAEQVQLLSAAFFCLFPPFFSLFPLLSPFFPFFSFSPFFLFLSLLSLLPWMIAMLSVEFSH